MPRVPRTAMRAARSPKRISCASVRVRGEKPCVPTCSDSSRFVLPTPFGPTASTRPGRRLELEPLVRPEVRERELSTTRLDGSAGQADRHDEVREVVALALDHGRPQRADQLEAHVVAVDRLEPVAQEVGVEADLERLAG